MGDLTCECGDPSEWDWYYVQPTEETEFSPLQGESSQACKSCKKVIQVGEICMTFERFSLEESEVDEDGEPTDNDIRLDDHHLCEACAEQWLNLTAIGYCIPIEENVMHYLQEYWDLTGFVPPGEQNEHNRDR